MGAKTLPVVHEMLGRLYSDSEWEALCNRCGKCCYESHWIDGAWQHTSIPCRFLDDWDQTCRAYANRFQAQDDCIKVTSTVVLSGMLPSECSYHDEVHRIVEEDFGGQDPRDKPPRRRKGKSRRSGERTRKGPRRRIHEG